MLIGRHHEHPEPELSGGRAQGEHSPHRIPGALSSAAVPTSCEGIDHGVGDRAHRSQCFQHQGCLTPGNSAHSCSFCTNLYNTTTAERGGG